jgi:precorrin-2 dehydrogenase / sirohydrochlorin ferrochelatase
VAARPCVCRRELGHCDSSCSRDLLETTFFPTFMNVRDRTCLVIGAGPIGLEKIEGLLASDARVVVVAPEAEREVAELAAEGSLVWHQRPFEPDDLEGALLVFAATSDTDLNIRIFRLAEARAMLVNVVDVPPLCNFIMPAIVRNGAVSIAISTSGASPALAKRLKREIADEFGEPYARLAELLNDARGWAKQTLPTYQDRKLFFESIVNGDPDPVELLRAGDEQAVLDLIAAAQRTATPA